MTNCGTWPAGSRESGYMVEYILWCRGAPSRDCQGFYSTRSDEPHGEQTTTVASSADESKNSIRVAELKCVSKDGRLQRTANTNKITTT